MSRPHSRRGVPAPRGNRESKGETPRRGRQVSRRDTRGDRANEPSRSGTKESHRRGREVQLRRSALTTRTEPSSRSRSRGGWAPVDAGPQWAGRIRADGRNLRRHCRHGERQRPRTVCERRPVSASEPSGSPVIAARYARRCQRPRERRLRRARRRAATLRCVGRRGTVRGRASRPRGHSRRPGPTACRRTWPRR